jgi:hypothetical protein
VEFLSEAVERESARPNSPRLTSFAHSWHGAGCAPGAHAARRRLTELLPIVERGENDDDRMRVHWWLAESLLALGERRSPIRTEDRADARTRRGYTHFLRLRARGSGAAPRRRSAAASSSRRARRREAGGGWCCGGPALLEIAASAPVARPRAALSVLAECGGHASIERLPGIARRRRGLASAARTTLARVEARSRRGAHSPPARPRPRARRGWCCSARRASTWASARCRHRRGARSARSTC